VSKKDDGVVNIHGKQYLTVARRTNDFRERHPDYGIHTEILSIDDATVVCRAVITDEAGRQISSGIAEESRTSSRINQTSAVENCETSAVGRALAFFGMAGTEIASADEVAGAISQQKQNEVDEALMAHAVAVRENLDQIHELKELVSEHREGGPDYMTAAGIVMDWDEETMQALRRAPSKGGIWTTQEVALLKADGAVGKCVATIKKQEYAEGAA
jgi:hypothetical protein